MPDYRNLLLDNGQYIPQYAGSPLEEAEKTNSEIATRHYTNLAKMSQLEIIANQLKSKALPGAKDYFDQHIGGIHEALSEMAKSGGENSTGRINALATHFQGDQGVLNIMQRSEEYQQKLKDIADIKKAGGTPIYDKSLHDYENASYIDPSTGKPHDMWQRPITTSPERYIDPTDDMQQILNQLHPNTVQSLLEPMKETSKANQLAQAMEQARQQGVSEDELPAFLHSTIQTFYPKGKLEAVANSLFENYKKTPSGQQQMVFAGKGNISTSDEKQLKDQLVAMALSKAYTEQREQFMANPRWLGVQGGTSNYQLPGGHVETPSVMLEKMTPNLTDFNWLSPVQKGASQIPGAHLPDAIVGQLTDEQKEVASQKFNQGVIAASRAYGRELDPRDPSTKEVVQKFFKDFYKDEAVAPYATTIIDPKSLNLIDQNAERNYMSYKYYDKDFKEVKVDTDPSSDWYKLTGGRPSKFKYNNTLSPYNVLAGEVDEDAAYGGINMVSAEVEGEKGGVKSFYVIDPAATTGTNILPSRIYNQVVRQPGIDVHVPGVSGAVRTPVGIEKTNALNILKQRGDVKNEPIVIYTQPPPYKPNPQVAYISEISQYMLAGKIPQ